MGWRGGDDQGPGDVESRDQNCFGLCEEAGPGWGWAGGEEESGGVGWL